MGQLYGHNPDIWTTRTTRTRSFFGPGNSDNSDTTYFSTQNAIFFIYLGHNSVSFFLNFFFKGYLKCIKMHFVFHQTWVREGLSFLFLAHVTIKNNVLCFLCFTGASVVTLSLSRQTTATGQEAECQVATVLYCCTSCTQKRCFEHIPLQASPHLALRLRQSWIVSASTSSRLIVISIYYSSLSPCFWNRAAPVVLSPI